MLMKKSLLALSLAAAFAVPQLAGAEGFAINEWSAEGVAMGGARMFADDDPANLAYNPAAITKVKGEAFKISATYISPHGRYDAEGVRDSFMGNPVNTESGRNVVHAAWVPGTYYVKQLNEKDWFGIGAFTRFGMLSEFERNSKAPSSNSFFAQLNGLSVTPTFAHKFDKKWSAAIGAEINYVGLELQKNLNLLGMNTGATQTKGESYALGWNAAANYAFDEKNELGVVYRSRIKHSMDADTDFYSSTCGLPSNRVGAYGEVTLPDSWSIGYGHKFNKNTRVELNATRTSWSTYDALNIYFDQPLAYIPIGGTMMPINSAEADKNWESGWRYAVGIEHKISDKYTVMAGYAYDSGSVPYDGGDFIVPTGNRRTYSIGGRYNDKKQALAVALGLMDIGDLTFKGNGATDNYSKVHTHDNYAKIFSISYERHF